MFSQINFLASFCFVLVLSFKDFQLNQWFMRSPKIGRLSTKSDLTKYLEALNHLVDFSGDHRNDIDINLYFGLFLTNVNLKRALEEKHEVLPVVLSTCVKEIIHKTEHLLDFYKYTIQQDVDTRNNKYKIIFSLFENETTWIQNLPKFHTTRMSEGKPFGSLGKFDMKWMFYKKYIDDRTTWVPNPHQSDLCLASLASAEEIATRTSPRCRVLKFCYDALKNGTDFGYALAHRLLLLQQAAFARSCNIFSEQEDKQMSHRFCNLAYQEAEYIAIHNFELVDLLLEHVCLCALDGHAVFLKRSWLTNILNFQTVDGCFSQTINSIYKGPARPPVTAWKAAKSSDHVIMDGYCNGHTSALAAATLATAARFIIQFYY